MRACAHVCTHKLTYRKDPSWVKKSYPDGAFDVSFRLSDCIDICCLIEHFKGFQRFSSISFGMYRNDALVTSHHTNVHILDRLRTDIKEVVGFHYLTILIDTNLRIVRFLNVTWSLKTDIESIFNIQNAFLISICHLLVFKTIK